MKTTKLSTMATADFTRLQVLLNNDLQHSHIHLADMPYRLTSIWQDYSGELKLWEQGDQLLAWAVFQPAWWNFDYVLQPSERGKALEKRDLGLGHWPDEKICATRRREFLGFC